MSKIGVLTLFCTFIVLVPVFNASAQKSKQRYEILRLIRQEKLDLVLPGAMRDNNVDMSTTLPIANGLSHTAYLSMTKALGEKYSSRIVSAENVITDFRVRRVQREIIEFSNACEIQRQIMDEALRRIKPGITTREETGWWAQDQLWALGLPPSYEAATLHLPYLPGVSHSEVSDRSATGQPGYVFQRGDFVSWDMAIGYLNFGSGENG